MKATSHDTQPGPHRVLAESETHKQKMLRHRDPSENRRASKTSDDQVILMPVRLELACLMSLTSDFGD